jgi:hypothetical protein
MNAGSGLDEEIWERLVEIIRAAHEMDMEVFQALELISHDYCARFGVLVKADRTVLEDTFRAVFERPR